ncbi:hypothetical protein AVW16_04675 [Crenobacter luteus]|uniref:DAGKc domain-containing protein n=1 Tax=Crenobacter luteus TaxID=1452487 RepID=A0A165G4G9_9NEIS|nr:hypothetical protein AVW16_04675 [Crenobacter luteus]
MNAAGASALPSAPVDRYFVVMNRASGDGDGDAARRALEAACAASGRACRFFVAARPRALERMALAALAAARREGGAVVAAGGDGTVNTVAAALLDSGVPLGVIPLGTFNYFARQHGIPLDAAGAARALVDGRARPVQLGLVNGRPYLNNASFGLYSTLIEARERHKGRLGRSRAVAFLSGLYTLLREHRSLRVEMVVDGASRRCRTAMVFFGNNPLQLADLNLPEAECVADGRLAAMVMRPLTRWDRVKLLTRGALGRLADDENLQHFCARTVEVRGHAGRVKVAIDGEVLRLAMPLRFSVRRDALTLLAPPDGGGAP